ncbi:tetratricopeptide repeat protein [Granulosicoccus sp.]|nr:tetratricopeptide repeat protein [Granulosicoccus sp.]MDB4222332.1 tetratricopeptide repeat protein [Granulosicoccus sp.]
MEYETEEQQVEALKAWWNENGRAVITGVVLGGAVIGGWTLWQNRIETQAIAASDGFSQTIEAVNSSDNEAAATLADGLQDDQPDSLYSSYANLAAARTDIENENLSGAADRLQWVAENAPQTDVQLIAKVRLARVQGALGDASAGLSSLPSTFPEAFAGLVEEARGDLLTIKGEPDAARTAYEAAEKSEYVADREGLTMKLNELAKADAS